MDLKRNTRPQGGADRAGDLSCLAADGSPIAQNPKYVQAAIADLRRDFVAECLRIAAVKAAHGADNIALGDDLNAERDIQIAIDHLKEAASSIRQLQRDLGEVPQ